MKKNIVKADGNVEPYDKDKINHSLLKAGTPPDLAKKTIREVGKKIKNNMSTTQIYHKTLDHLKKLKPEAALKYSLKRAIMGMGPDGFVFEEYIAKILNEYDFTTEVGKIINGYCVEHEVDVTAKRKGTLYFIECKYHNSPGIKSDLKTALYINSRFVDIEKAYIKSGTFSDDQIGAMLVTNTKCTSDAIKYASCVGLKIMAWHHPEVENLEYFIEAKKLYPVSILTTVTVKQKEKLFDSNIIMIKELGNIRIDTLTKLLSISYSESEKILNEVKILL
ncbi:MAG: ATP cone domain-containing protein [Actinomycetota bacterium]|nr:ATP cone domain-containing protein [Actinomycetota bacterium]